MDRRSDDVGTAPAVATIATLARHDVTVWRDHTDDVDVLADRLATPRSSS